MGKRTNPQIIVFSFLDNFTWISPVQTLRADSWGICGRDIKR
jgi:hypothetical protein